MILVAGGTGRLGGELVTSLRADGQDVRVLTRDARRAQRLRAQPIGATVLRCAAFAELHLAVLARTAGRGRAPAVLGRGDNPVNMVSVRDAVLAVLAAVRGEFRGRTLDVGGPDDVTLNELAETVRRRLGREDLPIRHVRRGALRALTAIEHVPRVPIGQIAAVALAMDTLPMTYAALHAPECVEWRGVLHVSDVPAAVVS